MKKNIVFIALLFTCIGLKAENKNKTPEPCKWQNTLFYEFCDTCGCGGNGGSMGFGTGLNNNFVGLRYVGQKYRSRDGIFENSPWINENFNTAQLWGKFPISSRILVNALVPYHAHNRTFSNGSEQKISGLGDATLLAFYKVIKPVPDSIISIKPEHSLQIGGGVKLPIGNFETVNIEGSVNPSFQLGTGSWDYLLAANYGITHRNLGFTALLNYTIKTENDTSYRFGNQWNYALNTYKTYYLSDRVALTPQLGVGGESFERNKEFGLYIDDTGGDILFGRLGMEANYNRYALGVSGMIPIMQHLNAGKVESKSRFSVYLNINI